MPDAMPAAFVFVLCVAAIFVAAIGSGLARVLWPDPPGVRPARLPWSDLLCFQLVMIVFVFVGAAKPAEMLARTGDFNIITLKKLENLLSLRNTGHFDDDRLGRLTGLGKHESRHCQDSENRFRLPH